MLWKRSAQYEGMPHDQYLQTSEGRRYQDANSQFAAWSRARADEARKRANAPPPANAQPAVDPYSASTGYQQQSVDMPSYQQPASQGRQSNYNSPASYQQPSALMLGADRASESWTPVPGYGFDKSGNQVPVGKGGIYATPTAYQNPYPTRPGAGRTPYQDNSMIGGIPSKGTTSGHWPAGWNGDQVRPDPNDPKTIQQGWLDRVKPEQRDQLAELFAQRNASAPQAVTRAPEGSPWGYQSSPPQGQFSPGRPAQANSVEAPAGRPGLPAIAGDSGFRYPGNPPGGPSTQSPDAPPFQAIWGDPFGGTSGEPLFARRDAFINNINEQMMPYYSGQAAGAPRFDFQDAWDRGGEMVEQGWQNPFAMTLGAIQGQSAPSMYAPAQSVETTSVRSGTPAPRQSVTTRTQPADPNRAQTLSSYSRSTARPTPIPAPGDARPSQDPYAYATGTGDSTSYSGMPAWFSGAQGRFASPQQRPAQTNKTGSVASRQLQSHASPR